MNSAKNDFVPTPRRLESLRRRVVLRGRSTTVQEMLGKPPRDSRYWLPLLRLTHEAEFFIPFTDKGVVLAVHSPLAELKALGTSAGSSDVICNGDGKNACVLCDCGFRRRILFLIPVYAPAWKSVGLLKMTRSRAPHALLPQILPAIQHARTSGFRKLKIAKTGRAEYKVSTSPVESSRTEDDRDITENWRFHGKYHVDLYSWHASGGYASIASVFISMTNAQIISCIPSMASALKNRKST